MTVFVMMVLIVMMTRAVELIHSSDHRGSDSGVDAHDDVDDNSNTFHGSQAQYNFVFMLML